MGLERVGAGKDYSFECLVDVVIVEGCQAHKRVVGSTRKKLEILSANPKQDVYRV